MRMKITSDMTPLEIMELYPEAEAIFEIYFSEESHLDPDHQHESLHDCALREGVDIRDVMDEFDQVFRDLDEFYKDDDERYR